MLRAKLACWFVLPTALLALYFSVTVTNGQMSTDPRLCGGYLRETRGFIDFKFNDNTAPPDTPQTNKFCMWTISPTVPSEQFTYDITIKNVKLNCPGGVANDGITINFFNETAHFTNTLSNMNSNESQPKQLCIPENEVWTRKNVNATLMVVILHVSRIVQGHGFYMEWKEANSRIPGPGRVRRTYYTYGDPSVDPNPYYAAGFLSNELATFGFIKANYSEGYRMQMQFTQIKFCEGQEHWPWECFNNSLIAYQIENDGSLKCHHQYFGQARDTIERPFHEECTLTPNVKSAEETSMDSMSSNNGFFIVVKIQNKTMSGGSFKLVYDTIRT